MLDMTNDTQSLTNFRRHSGKFMRRLKQGKRPLFITVEGKVEAVLQDPASYQRLLDIAARASAAEGIRQGLADAKAGKGRDVDEFFAEFEATHGISR
jgi:prevent-host-death family protein